MALRSRILVELVHSPEQGKNPLDFPNPQQTENTNENFRGFFAIFSRIKMLVLALQLAPYNKFDGADTF